MNLAIFHLLATSVLLAFAKTSDKDPYKLYVKGLDFVNTNVEKICLIASINARIDITERFENGSESSSQIEVPQGVSTEGSYCNRDFSSLLRINFENSKVEMTFTRLWIHEEAAQTGYCEDCNYGTWNLSKLSIDLTHEGYNIQGSVTQQDIIHEAPEMTAGIEIKRSFVCPKRDKNITFPFHITKVKNSTNGHEMETENWAVRITFEDLKLQPFLVFNKHGSDEMPTFSDPYLCRDVIASHIVIILIPLVYFTIFIAFYRIKHAYGCPPKCDDKGKDQESMTQIELEESTNILSDDCEALRYESSSNYV